MIYSFKNKREKHYAIITIAVLIGTALFLILVDPQLQRHAILSSHMSELNDTLTKMKANMLLKDRIDKKYTEVEPLITSNLNDQHEISLFARGLNDLYAGLPIKISSIKILPLVRTEFLRQLTIKIEMNGTIDDILKFIRSIETSTQLLKIDKLVLSAREAADRVQATFLISKIITASKESPNKQREGK